jgi:hypothetical protein
MNLLIELCSTGEALPWRVQDPRGMYDSTPKAHTKKVVYRPQPTGQLKDEPKLLQKEVPRSSGKRPKRSSKSESLGIPHPLTEELQILCVILVLLMNIVHCG